MSINKKIIIAAILGITFGFSSCKKFLNVNTNPNTVFTPTLPVLLTGGELYVGTAVGVDLEIDGSFFAEYWTQSPGASQYLPLDKYAPGQDQFSPAWSNLYAAAENFYQLEKLADSQKSKNYKAIALLMQAYTFQLITDAWGDVPYKEALKGQYADGHVVNPHYDPQDTVYKYIIAMIDSANALIDLNATAPGSDDLIFTPIVKATGTNIMTFWQEFSNTLALKVYLRMAHVAPATAQAGIAALYANPTTSVFIGSTPGDDAYIGYGWNTTNQNPLYSDGVGLGYTENFVACNTCMDTMRTDNDPRINIFYEVSQKYGFDTGLVCGLYYNIPYQGYSYLSGYVAGDVQNGASASAPVNLITGYESLFLQAEAVARGWAPATVSDAALFQQAIAANFNYYNNAFSSAMGSSGAAQYTAYTGTNTYWTQYPAAGTLQQKLMYIITQKYFAMCGNQGFEAWTEWRRTGYPNWFTYSVSAGTTTFPKRFLYPTSESVVNANYPGLKDITATVWWDVQSAVQGTADH